MRAMVAAAGQRVDGERRAPFMRANRRRTGRARASGSASVWQSFEQQSPSTVHAPPAALQARGAPHVPSVPAVPTGRSSAMHFSPATEQSPSAQDHRRHVPSRQ